MKKKQFNLYNDKNQPSKELLEILDEKSIINRPISLNQYLEKDGYDLDLKEFTKLKQQVEKSLVDQLKLFTLMQFQLMSLCNDWMHIGEQQIKQSFARQILNIPPSEALTYTHLETFNTKLTKLLKYYEIQNATKEELKSSIQNFRLSLFSKSFSLIKEDEINNLLRFLTLNLKVIYLSANGYFRLFLSTFKIKIIGTYEIVFLENELARSPNCILALAAFSYERNIGIRKEVLLSVFYQKWMAYFDYIQYDSWSLAQSDERNISEGIKKYIFELRSIKNEDDLEGDQKQFVKDLSETIIYHELGHIIFNKDVMDIKIGAIVEATRAYGDTIFVSILEILADFAPKNKKIQGPIINMVKVFKVDPKRAESLFYIYISDVWFYDTEDKYMYDYANLIIVALLQYINPDRSVDFEQMEKDFSMESIHTEGSNINYLVSELKKCSDFVQHEIRNEAYTLANKPASFSRVEMLVKQEFESKKILIDDTSYRFLTSFWKKLIFVKSNYGENQHSIYHYITNEREKIMNSWFERCAGKSAAQKYEYDCKKYIFDQFKALNLIAIKSGS